MNGLLAQHPGTARPIRRNRAASTSATQETKTLCRFRTLGASPLMVLLVQALVEYEHPFCDAVQREACFELEPRTRAEPRPQGGILKQSCNGVRQRIHITGFHHQAGNRVL